MFSEGSDLSDLSDAEEIESAPPQSLPEASGSVAEMEDEEESSERGQGAILDEKPPVIGEPLPTGTLGEFFRDKASSVTSPLTLLLLYVPTELRNSLGKASYVPFLTSF